MKSYYTDTIDSAEQREIINEVVESIRKSENDTRKTIETLVDNLIGGFNAYKSVDKYLKSSELKDLWKKASQRVFDEGNSGWATCVKELLEIMYEEIENKE